MKKEKKILAIFSFDRKDFAFTLAEILITIAIIGVVATIILPNFLRNQRKIIYANRAKQSYAQILNAIILSEAQNGDFGSWNFLLESNSTKNTEEFMKTYLLPYFKGISLCSTGLEKKCGKPISASGKNYTLSNGTTMSIVVHNGLEAKRNGHIWVIFDVNGKNPPNEYGIDAFGFSTNNPSGILKPLGWYSGVTISNIKNNQVKQLYDNNIIKCLNERENSSSRNRHACTLWLYLNNWKMDKNYPL